MSPSLPRQPSLEHLKKQAKQLHASHQDGNVKCCSFFRQLNRFSEAIDEQILSASIPLAEAQMVVAMHYGFASWSDLKKDVQTRPDAGDFALEAVIRRSREEIPEYAGAGVPVSVVSALNKAGVDIDFMEFAAASGWAFSFGYYYDDISPAYMAVRGKPDSDGPFEVFTFLPQQFGFEYEMALTAEPDALWNFVKEHVDKDTLIMSEHMDGGLRSIIEDLDDEAAELIAGAADQYGKAYRNYDQYRSMIRAGEPTSMNLQDRARTPERIAAIVALFAMAGMQ